MQVAEIMGMITSLNQVSEFDPSYFIKEERTKMHPDHPDDDARYYQSERIAFVKRTLNGG
jgi:hypothetical protein